MTEVFSRVGMAHSAPPRSATGGIGRVLPEREIDAALAEISAWEGYAPTPLVALPDLAGRIGVGTLLYKDEGPRFGLDSFKALGGAYAALRLLAREVERRRGTPVSLADVREGRCAEEVAGITLCSATDGNHGRAVAWGARRFGAPCRIYIHAAVSEGRAEALRRFGAEVVRIQGDYDATVEQVRVDAEANGWFIVSDTSWPGYSEPPRDVMAGYGVMGREICKQADRPATHVFIQGGVGGLAAGVIAALRQGWGASPRMIVVEPDRAACLLASARAGSPAAVAIADETIMAGLSCGEASPLAWEILSDEVSDWLAIPDSLVGPAMRMMACPPGSDPAISAGESAVAGLCGLMVAAEDRQMRATLGLGPESRCLVIGSEGITDPEIYEKIMAGADSV